MKGVLVGRSQAHIAETAFRMIKSGQFTDKTPFSAFRGKLARARSLFSLQRACGTVKIQQLKRQIDVKNEKMAGKITIDTERCKGCRLCVTACPRDGIVISKRSNKNGYFPAQPTDCDCTGCAMCALICPEAIIKVYREDTIVAKSGKKTKSRLVGEKA
jgi:2-oxoglutarate ferredoxin oxidoreductase subunit delta